MDPIQEAIEEIESREPGTSFSYRQVAKKYGISHVGLAQRHQGKTQPRALAHLALHPQREKELVQYIESLTERRTPPSRAIIRNIASSLLDREVSESWISRFLHRNSSHLISRWQTPMDSDRHKADSATKYKLYFELLHNKMKEYDIQPSHIFNMDEKGFLLGVLGKSKRVFSKRQYERGGVVTSLQDGSREWITVLACICSDGTPLSPSIIFQSAAGTLKSAWVEAIDPNKHSVFVASSHSGWTNNDIGLAWLKEVFERETVRYARTGYRLLIVDGHSSHVTMDFLEYCNNHRILVAVYPPHSTHRLQPLDVGMFGPLASAYSKELTNFLHLSYGLLPLAKGDFFELFWRAWQASFRKETIISSFKATGISPPNPGVILQRFQKEASSSDESSSSVLSAEDWLKIESIIRREVKDFNNKEAKKLRRTLHHISVQNSLLRAENEGLKGALKVKKRHQKKNYTLQLNRPEDYHGGAVFWSPKKIRQAKEDEMERQQQQQQLQLQKAERSELKKQAQLYKLQLAQEKRVERERLKEAKEKERAEKQAEKERQKAARDSGKALQLSQKGKRKASQGSSQKEKRQKRGGGVNPSHVQVEVAEPAIPTQTTRLGRTTKVPSKFR